MTNTFTTQQTHLLLARVECEASFALCSLTLPIWYAVSARRLRCPCLNSFIQGASTWRRSAQVNAEAGTSSAPPRTQRDDRCANDEEIARTLQASWANSVSVAHQQHKRHDTHLSVLACRVLRLHHGPIPHCPVMILVPAMKT